MATTKLLNNQCSHCEVVRSDQHDLSTCGGCRVVLYCSKDHQKDHWSEHKSECNAVKKARTTTDKQEQKLRSHEGDFMMPANPFDQPGHFWGWLETRPYMRARYSLIDALRKIRTREAVDAARIHAMDIFRLNRSDNMGVRDMVPALMLRIGMDQQAYDFMKWHATTGNDAHYDWGDMDLPFLNLHGEDPFEPLLSNWTGNYPELAAQVSITLIKLRLLLDLQELERRNPVGERVPQEVLDLIRVELASNTVKNNDRIMQDVRNGASLKPYIDNLKEQTDTMFEAVEAQNRHFWRGLIHPAHHLTARPEAYSNGSVEEMQLMLQYSYEAWDETPEAIDWVMQKCMDQNVS